MDHNTKLLISNVTFTSDLADLQKCFTTTTTSTWHGKVKLSPNLAVYSAAGEVEKLGVGMIRDQGEEERRPLL